MLNHYGIALRFPTASALGYIVSPYGLRIS
jgi:hypothetical protein